MKLFLFLLLLTLVSCKEPLKKNRQETVHQTVNSKIFSTPRIPKEIEIDSISKELMGTWVNIEYSATHQGLKDKMTSTSVLWANEYFDLEIPSKYDSCQMVAYSEHLDQDSVETTSEMGCSIGAIPFELTHLKLDSVKVEQARLEFISISQPPSDGFYSATLNELVLQSDWVSYKKKDKIYVPFSYKDSRFKIKGKPKLSTAFIREVLKKSKRQVATELLTKFMATDQEAYWEYCTLIIRITGVNKEGKRVVKYIVDHELCLQD